MTFLSKSSSLFGLVFYCLVFMVSSKQRYFTTPNVPHLTDSFTHVPIDQGFSEFFGLSNFQVLNNGSVANLALDNSSGSGIISKNKYHYGFFSAAIKLPAGFSSGIVVAFYLSNADDYPHNHDEIDIELLGHAKRDDWVLQTNIYANGSVSSGREEKFHFWFDPTQEYHSYSIIWNSHHIVFLMDNIPVREIPNNGVFSSFYPSKPMSLYFTIWDGSEWASGDAKYPVNYKYAPFVSSISQTEMSGCIFKSSNFTTENSCLNKSNNVSSLDPVDGEDFVKLSKQQSMAMDWARKKLMIYSYCKDIHRYKVMPLECK